MNRHLLQLLPAMCLAFACSSKPQDLGMPEREGMSGSGGKATPSSDPSSGSWGGGPGGWGPGGWGQGGFSGDNTASQPSGGAPSLAIAGGSPLDRAGSDASSACAAKNSETTLQPVNLFFALDVSGSMGKLDKPYHDPVLKWEPVVGALKAFFSDSSSHGIFASLSFFPAKDHKCDANTYQKPTVSITELPSSAFADAIDAITPQSADDWRGGTPTLAVVQGTIQFAESSANASSGRKQAMVLVTDGYPQDCDDDDNTISAVSEAVRTVAATLPTYVIGVSNPKGGPDTVSDLQQVAVAGGTSAFLVETGDATKTAADFRAVIDGIRGQTVDCRVPIPPPPEGEVFDPAKVNVTSWLDSKSLALVYDPKCEAADSWRYDDPDRPAAIEICPEPCAALQAASAGKLVVEFGCQQRLPEIR